MAVDLTEDLTTGVNWEWRENGIPLVEVDIGTRAPNTSITRTFTLKHDNSEPVVIRGFYLSPLEDLGEYEPFKSRWLNKTPAKDIETLLEWGDLFGVGIFMVQGAASNRFRSGIGSSIGFLLPSTLGPAGDGRINPNTFVTLGVRVDIPSQLQSIDWLNFNIKIAYRRTMV